MPYLAAIAGGCFLNEQEKLNWRMKRILCLIFMMVAISSFAQKHFYLLAGTYTGGKSKGIYVYDFNSANGEVTIVDSVITSNPSYLAVAPDQRFVYAVNEDGNGDGKVSAFTFDKSNGKLSLLNQQPSLGDHPCYIAIDKTGKWIFVGNYSSGSLAALPVKEDGSIGEPEMFAVHKGRSINEQRQTAPHVHATVLSPDNKYLFVPDLGIDRLVIYSFDPAGKLSRDSSMRLEDGAGPRHFDFHPNGKWAYLLNELSGTVTAYDYRKGQLQPVQNISTLPADFTGKFTSADIHVSPDGKFLYASNRDASNTIAIFKVDAQSGKLSLAGHQSTLGKTPRNFSLDPTGNFLLVANQNSDEIVIFRVNKETGGLADTGQRVSVGKPVCIKWAAK